MRHYILTLMLALACVAANAAAPDGYYNSLSGLSTPQELKDAVYALASSHTHPDGQTAYEAYYKNLSRLFLETDVYPNDSRRWWEMYANAPFQTPSFAGMNREHSFPKSWWGGLTNIPPYVDLYHLYPSEAKANMAKSNYPLGEVNMSESVYFDNGVSKVGYAKSGQGGGAKYVFEPANEYKGDFARTYFYMVTIYQDLTWNKNYMYMLQQNLYPTLKPWAYEMLLDWARHDPVSQKEIDRNEAVYRIQNNRNPFIDNPELAEYIWGNKRNQPFTPATGGATPGTTPQLFAPVDGMALDFGQTAAGQESTRQLLISGENLTGNISLIVTGDNRDQFTIESRTLSTALVNRQGGYYFTVTYRPTTGGSHNANLTIYGVSGWGSGSLNVTLTGECVGVPSLKQIKALPATDVTENSYMANWEVPEGDVVDYYVVNRTHYVDGVAQIDELIAEDNSLLITDYNPHAYDSYTVQSVRLGYRSPLSNAIVVAQGGIVGVDAGQPLVVEVYPGSVRIVCAQPQTGVCVYDISGRLTRLLPAIERNQELTLPTGVWFIVTDQHRSPVKVLVK